MAKILIVDDEPGMRQVVLNVLKPEGHQLFSAEDGAQAIETAKNERPNLVMLDMRLPDMDGLEILAEIKKMLPETTVIMLSGFGDVESAVGAMKQGAFDYISKPFKVDEVISQVRKALGTQSLAKDGMIRKTETSSSSAGQTAAAQPVSTGSKGKSSKLPIIIFAVILVLSAGFGVFMLLSSSGKNAMYTVPYSNPTSIAYDGTYLWVTDWVTQSFYKHKIDKMLSMVQTYYIQDSHPTGVTYDGQYLWSSNSWESVIYKHKLDKSLTVVATFQSPGPEPSGLYWDGVYLWICDIGQAKIFQTKITDEGLVTINEFDSPGNNPVGIFKQGTDYWIGDSETNRIYKVNQNFSVLGVYIIPQFEQGESRLSAIGWDGKTIWACSDESQTIYRTTIKNLKKLQF